MHAVALILALLPATTPPRIAADTPYMTLAVEMSTNAAGIPVIYERFSTLDAWHHSVLCASGFLDVTYVLRDATGKVVPVGNHRHYEAVGSENCKRSVVPIVNRAVLLTDVYPNLKRGSYTLYLTLAPRNTRYRANLPPITFNY